MTENGLVDLYRQFMRVNEKLKQVFGAWQGRMIGDQWIPNNHQDPEYDFQVIDRLWTLHERLKRVLCKDEGFAQKYLSELDRCMQLIGEGMYEYMIQTEDSYHSLLWKVHKEFANRTGVKYREEEDFLH